MNVSSNVPEEFSSGPARKSYGGGINIAFIGNSIQLPEANLELARRVLGDVDVFRVSSLAELEAHDEEEPAPARLLVVAECRAEDLVRRYDAYRIYASIGQVVLAYDQPSMARYVLDSPIGDLVSYLPMRCPTDAWTSFIRLYCFGQSVVPKELLGKPEPDPEAKARVSDATLCSGLTRREYEVVSLVADGLKNREISDRLRLSEHTVKLHLHNTFRKIGVSNRAGAAAWFLANAHNRA